MIKAKNRILSLALALCLVLGMTLYLPGPVEVQAITPGGNGAANDGINFDRFVGDGFYFGSYDHAGPTNGTETPILWRAMGEENSSGNLTLFSEYVLDTHVFNSNYYGDNAQNYVDSELNKWLNGTFFNDIFQQAEANGVAPVDVVTGMYDAHNSDQYVVADYYPVGAIDDNGNFLNPNTTPNTTINTGPWPKTAAGQYLYIPHGGYRNNKVYWEAGNTRDPSYELVGMKAKYKDGDVAVYWLRSPLSDFSDNVLYFSDNVFSTNTSGIYGVRAAFQLNPESIIFLSEIVSGDGDGMGTINADDNYSSIAAGGGDANFKLTVVGGNNGADVGTLTNVPDSSTNVSLQRNSSFWLDLESGKTSNDGDYTVNYKIVSGGGTRTIESYGFTPAEEDTALEIDASGLGDGTYTVYVWLQKNNRINSHEGTMPQHFTLNVSSNGPTYGLALGTSGNLDFGSRVEGYDPAELEQTVAVTATGGTDNLRARLSGADKDSFTVSAVSGGQFTVAPKSGLAVGGHTATVTVVGDYAQPQSFTVSFAVMEDTDRPTVSGGPLTLKPGESGSFTVALGKGSEGAESATVTSGDEDIATVDPDKLTQSGPVTVTGVSKGDTTITIGYSGGARHGKSDTVRVTVTEQPVTRVQVDFDPQGGSPTPAPIEVAVGGSYPALPTVTRVGFTFDGWYTSPSGGSKVQAGDTLASGSDHTLYARWSEDGDGNGNGDGSGGSNGNGNGDGGGSASSGSSSSRSSSGGRTPDRQAAKTQLPASAFSWDGRTLTIDHDSVSVLGLLSVGWDGQSLNRGANYAVYSGSVIIRFGEEFIAAQAPGEHTVRVEFLNHIGETTVTVGGAGLTVLEDNDTHNPSTGGYPDGNYPGDTDNPNTGSGGIWPVLLLGSLGAAALVCAGNRKRLFRLSFGPF